MIKTGSDRLSRRRSREGQEDWETTPPRFERVRPKSIDRSNELFSMSFEPDLGRLRESVQRVGILEPVWLRRKGRGFHIIHGFGRFDVTQTLGQKDIPALIWGEGEINDRLAFEMSLHQNVLTRGLNVVEKGLVLGKLLSCFGVSRGDMIQTHLALLGLEPNERVLESHLVINAFSEDQKRYLLSHGVSLANIQLLAKFSGAERESICRFLSPLRIGQNVLKEVLTCLKEIAQRDEVRADDPLSDRAIHHVVLDRRLSGPQKIQMIRDALRQKRYPRLSALEKRFKSWRKAVTLSPGVAIKPPPFFEGDRFKIEIIFRSLGEYEARLGELQSLSREMVRKLLTIKGYDNGLH